ncbi:Sec20 family protein [Thalictrum thalictroides]|uniref:Sec20 family protein n=1 Tax=Thalictrum thalictroides TaxID=46969 RepID=A0A7J6WST8_THATH|nr:Sec20 family protein [Thalictrum thalictroides]
MDEVVLAVEKVKKEWDEIYTQTLTHVKSIEEYGKLEKGIEEANSLQRLNGLAQDGLALLRSLQLRLDLLAPQMPTEDEVQSAQSMFKSWKDQYQSLHLGLRNANLQAKANIRKAAQAERELLLGGGGESTILRRNMQTKAGMTSAAESITDSLRRSRQLMVQEVERSSSMLTTFEESTGVLKKAESEYKGHRSLLMRTRNLLSTMSRQDVLDRLILIAGFVLFSCAVLYVVSKRMGVLTLQRKVTAAIKAGLIGQGEMRPVANEDRLNQIQVNDRAVPDVQNVHDEL